ncbi:MAG: hypothetical protein IBJ10_09965 [Phycisphaerales bacterium]|nr:hypothetical protein [Phycisphaerales bacterium]
MALKTWKENAATGNPGTTGNWNGGTPVTGNDVAFNAGSVSVSVGEDALAAVDLGLVRVESGYAGSHGDEDTPFKFDADELVYNGRGAIAHYDGDLGLVRIVGTGSGLVILDCDGSEELTQVLAGGGRLLIKSGAKLASLIVKDCQVQIEAGVTISGPIVMVGGRGSVTTASSTAGVSGSRGRVTYTGAAGDTAQIVTTGTLIDVQSSGTFADVANYATDRGGVQIGGGSLDVTFTDYAFVDGARQDFDPMHPPARVTITNDADRIDFGLVGD